ncbi:hypothetical protein Hanom_Chr04g00324501 [Helianthus anomalus]
MKTSFEEVHEDENKNAQLLNEFSQLLNKMQQNVAKLASINVQELSASIPPEASTKGTSTSQLESVTPASQSWPTPMGTPPPASRTKIIKRFDTLPLVISKLCGLPKDLEKQPKPSKRTSSSETPFSESLNIIETRRYGESATSSKRPKLV